MSSENFVFVDTKFMSFEILKATQSSWVYAGLSLFRSHDCGAKNAMTPPHIPLLMAHRPKSKLT